MKRKEKKTIQVNYRRQIWLCKVMCSLFFSISLSLSPLDFRCMEFFQYQFCMEISIANLLNFFSVFLRRKMPRKTRKNSKFQSIYCNCDIKIEFSIRTMLFFSTFYLTLSPISIDFNLPLAVQSFVWIENCVCAAFCYVFSSRHCDGEWLGGVRCDVRLVVTVVFRRVAAERHPTKQSDSANSKSYDLLYT